MYFEEFDVGQQFHLPPLVLTSEEILEFARRYDPQPIHIDPDFAHRGPFGGVIASGFHTLSAVWGQWIAEGRLGTESLGGTGLERADWRAPVRPGDTLTTTVTVAQARASRSKPRGILRLHFETRNQTGAVVLVTDGIVLVRRRPGAPSLAHEEN